MASLRMAMAEVVDVNAASRREVVAKSFMVMSMALTQARLMES